MSTLSEYMQFKREKLDGMRALLKATNTPPAPLKATCRVAGASGVRPVQVRQFTMVTDSGAGLAGYDLGPTAPELLLSALASCIAHTFLIVGASQGISYEALEVEVAGVIDFRGVLEVDTSIPTTPTNLSYQARIRSAASAETIEQLRQHVERLCPVLQAVTQPSIVQGQVILEP